MSDNWIVGNLQSAFETWNGKISEIWSLITTTPQAFHGGAIWTTIVTINEALKAVGYGLLVLFFAMSVFQSAVSFRDFQRPEFVLRHFIRFLLAKLAVGSAMDIMTGIFSVCGSVVQTVMNSIGGMASASVSVPQEIVDAIEGVGFLASIPLWLVSLLGSLFITIMSFILILTVYGRFFRLYFYTALAPIPLASFAGEGTSFAGKAFLKSYIGVCMEGAVIVLPKRRGIAYAKAPFAPKTARTPFKASPRPLRAAGQTAQRRMTQQAVKRAGKAAKNTAAARRVVQAVTKAVASLVSSLIGLVGGGILLIVLVVVIIIAAVANSPFGLFFAEERSAPDTVSVAEAVGTVNVAYNTKLEELQAGDYDSIDVTGAAADWPDVLAVFAARYAGAEDGIDVATLDADRVSKLTATFWDMTALTSTVETIDHPDSDPDDDTDDSWTERILHLTITAKTAEDMKTAYGFTAYQISALDELLADRAALSSLAGSLAITNADVREVLAALPADLEQARRDTVQTALQLVGKVNYFWGGKSRAIGWDSRWGQLTKVWAAGSSTTGTYRPFGLDCSGFVDWTFNNSLGYIIGHGGGVIMQHRYCTDISQSAAQPGDLAFYPDDSHIGIIVGRNEAGKLLVCHCASGQNNVVITEFSVSGFTAVGRPDIFD